LQTNSKNCNKDIKAAEEIRRFLFVFLHGFICHFYKIKKNIIKQTIKKKRNIFNFIL